MLHPVPKVHRIHDAEYLRYLGTLPCCVCAHLGERQTTRTEAHHVVRTRGAFGGDNGAAPFCIRHHTLWHLIGRKSFRARVGVDPTVMAATLWRRWRAEGWSA